MEVGLSLLLHLLCSRTVQDSLPPCPEGRQVLLDLGVESIALVSEDEGQKHVPGNERQVCVGVLVTDKVLRARLFEVLVQDCEHTLDLVAVSLDCRFDLLRMVVGEPDALAEVRALSGDLEVEPDGDVSRVSLDGYIDCDLPLLQQVLLRGGSVCELVLLVILLDQVLDNGTRLPEGDASVGVLDGRCSSVDTELLVLGLLEVGKVPELVLVGETELLHEQDNLPWVGTTSVAVDENRLERHVCASD